MKIIRVFPRKTNATPVDELSAINRAPLLWEDADAIHVSTTFDSDLPRAEWLAKQWSVVAPVTMGGPALNSPAEEFTPGLYLRPGYVITSRGCPNACPRCKVPTREGALRLLKIADGWNVLDNNLLGCPDGHVREVFEMLKRQSVAARFTGGLEAHLLKQWHVDALVKLNPETIWTAFDRPEQWEPVVAAVAMFKEAGLIRPHSTKRVGAYVLMGFKGDTLQDAERRLRSVISLGIKTQAMLLDNGAEMSPGDRDPWFDLRRHFTNAATVGKMVSETWEGKAQA